MATKKIKKVETPIDQRETFVSLQKSFGETGLSIEEKLQTLYALQKADNAIEALVQLRGELPEEVRVVEEEVQKMKAKADQIAMTIEGCSASIEKCKEDIDECDAAIEKYQKQIEGIQNSREYDSLSREIENQELLRKIAQKTIGETREMAAQKSEALESLRERISIREEDLAAKRSELESIVESTAEKEAELVARREECAAKIDERTLSAYERIKNSVHNHLAVVPVFNGDSCGGCFGAVTPQRLIDIASGKKLVICEHCGRIIVNNPEETPAAE